MVEIRTLQNDVIGTIRQLDRSRFEVLNYRSDKVELSTFKDSRTFIMRTYWSAGKAFQLERGLQLNLF